MNILYSLFFAAGVAGFTYAKFGRRLGYSNAKSIWTMVGITFVISFFVFFTLTTMLLHR
jgi:hypothetical protein